MYWENKIYKLKRSIALKKHSDTGERLKYQGSNIKVINIFVLLQIKDLRSDDATATRTSKINRFYSTQNNNFARATLFCTFLLFLARLRRGSPTGFFNPVIPTQADPKFHAIPYSYFWHLTTRAYVQFRISQRTWTSNDEILFLFLNLNIALGIQLQEGLPTFDKVRGRNKSG